MTTLTVELKPHKRAHYSPGDVVRGHVVTSSQRDVQCNQLLARLLFVAHGLGGDVYTTFRIRLSSALQQAGYLPKLATDFMDHVESSFAYCRHRD